MIDMLEYKKRKRNLNSNGFSLIEVVVAMAIFAFIIGGITTFSINSIEANTKSQAMQEAIDNTRYIIDDLAKKVRTSSSINLSNDNKALFFIDNQTLIKYCYQFENGRMLVSELSPKLDSNGLISSEGVYKTVKTCNNLNNQSLATVIVGDSIKDGKLKIFGKFSIMKTEINTNNPHRGFVRINIGIKYDGLNPNNSAESHVQTGVSLVDYGRENEKL